MPPRPGFIDQFDFITFYAVNFCDGPAYVYMEAARRPAFDLAIGLMSFGLGDVVRSLFKPKGLRSARHGRKGRKGGKRGVGLPEIPDLVADRIPAVQQLQARKIDDGLKYLWIVDEVFQRAAWTVGLWSMVNDFFYDSFLGVITDDAAQCDFKVTAMRQNAQIQKIGVLRWQALPLPFVKYVRGPIGTTSGYFNVGPGKWLVVMAADIVNLGATREDCQIRLRFDDASGTSYATHDLENLDPGFPRQQIVSDIRNGPFLVQGEMGGTTGTPAFQGVTAVCVQIG